ncbi:MAG TPA: type VI secretion system-associated FHA domain protein TagH [Gammaproteobacteria bacterium]|nr:type VI secretion system-associated FHA domain protein TagH [Gammaproteobacteria bacterium]
MALTLRVTSFHSQALGPLGTKVFGAGGGSIGRNEGNDWVLPDPERFISGSHAVISCRNGTFYLRDVSTNGTFVNGSAQPVGKGMEQPLTEGDRLQIGEYEITVSLDRSDFNAVTDFNLGRGGGFGANASGPRVTTGSYGTTGPYGGSQYAQPYQGQPSADAIDLFGQLDAPGQGLPPPDVQPDHAPALDQYYQPPEIQRPLPHPAPHAENVIPDDWDKTGYSQAASRRASHVAPPPPLAPMPPPQPQQHVPSPLPMHAGAVPAPPPAAEVAGGIAALLAAAGVDPATARVAASSPGVHSVLGSLLAIVVQGMLDVLKARADIKSSFRVPVTSMRPVENNPLKFSANAAQALQNLLAPRNQAYLGPVEAFDEGFEDIKAHQMAMMAGMRAAFDSMLKRFDPEELSERFEKRLKRAALINIAGKGRYWDLYRDLYEEWTQDADLNFQRLFGEKFAQAYEEQMRRLTSVRR